MCPDRVVAVNGTIRVSTKTGETMTSANVMAALRDGEERRPEQVYHRQQAQEQRQQGVTDRQQKENERAVRRSTGQIQADSRKGAAMLRGSYNARSEGVE